MAVNDAFESQMDALERHVRESIPAAPHPSLASPEEWVTREEAARHAGVSVSTIDRWRQLGLASYRAPGTSTVRIRREDLHRFLSGELPEGCG